MSSKPGARLTYVVPPPPRAGAAVRVLTMTGDGVGCDGDTVALVKAYGVPTTGTTEEGRTLTCRLRMVRRTVH